MHHVTNRKWWKEGVVYQIYPRSFQDSTGNGIGDLRGIVERLDYIKSLGIDIIWLNPVYASPNDDNGYDIADYRGIMPEFGTMEDFDLLLAGIRERGLKLVMDLVVNHSSDEHNWFLESRKSRNSAYRDYYHWWPAEKGTPPKRWSYFDVEGDAWNYDERTDAYYLHSFSEKQPDLKWENPKVRKEVYDIMKFWFDKGVDGFRMDVISFISKDTDYPELPSEYEGDFVSFYSNGPKLHEYLHEMHTEVLDRYDVMTVGEAPGIGLDKALDFVDEDRKELNMFFHFDLMALDREEKEVFLMRKDKWKLSEFKKIHSDWDAAFAQKGWGSMFLNNHDFPRSVSRWGDDSEANWHHSATMLQTFLLTMRGTPYFYYGEEIGMTNIEFDRISEYRDINTLNRYQTLKREGGDLEAFLLNEKDASRDNARTPMQWDGSKNAGFSKQRPWLRVNGNHTNGINVASQENDPNSVLNHFRKMVHIRKQHLGLIYGSYRLLQQNNEDIYAYTRTLDRERYLVILGFTDKKSTIVLGEIEFDRADLLISNDGHRAHTGGNVFELMPYQACVYVLR